MGSQLEFQQEIISVDAAASFLGISTATLRNWVKLGVIERDPLSKKLQFYKSAIDELNRRILNGDVARLSKRANKNKSNQLHAHSELLKCPVTEGKILSLIECSKATPNEFLYCLYLCLLERAGLLPKDEFNSSSASGRIQDELMCWGIDEKKSSHKELLESILASNLDLSVSLLGFAYQALSHVGKKHRLGAYYTPNSVVTNVVADLVNKDGKFLDPCCGSGNFLIDAFNALESAGVEEAHSKIFGIDLDLTAVLTARAALTLVTNGKSDSIFQIKHGDALFEFDCASDFDFICSNPPWGASFPSEYEKQLKTKFNVINSGESFSYFILSSVLRLKEQGVLSFVLPESILNVKMHKDIRVFLLDRCKVLRISSVNERFSGVFTKAVVVTLQPSTPDDSHVVNLDGHLVPRHVLLKDPDRVIPLGIGHDHSELFRLIESGPRLFLKDNADWALGIVTGDNGRFLSDSAKTGYESILKGTDLLRFRTRKPNTFIKFDRDELQQTAPEEKYRAEEKLIYRFICKELVFSIDRTRALTLNSANVLIPKVPGYSLRAVCGILNSKLAQVYYQKKFNSIKTLRGNLEKFPFPRLLKDDLSALEAIVARLEIQFESGLFDELNEIVLDIYEIPEDLRSLVRSEKLSSSFSF